MRIGIAGLLTILACNRHRAIASDAATDVTVVDAGIGTPIGPPRAATPTAPYFDKAILLANGHVLMPEKDAVHDWDPFSPAPMRKVKTSEAGPAHTFSFAPIGGRRFVVAKTDEEDTVQFDLWDAEKLTFIRALGSPYNADTPLVEFSPDGKRLLLLACSAVRERKRTCEMGVHDLATGDLVRRVKVAPFASEMRGVGRLSTTGKYFAVSVEEAATVAFDADSGKEVFRGPTESMIDEETRGDIIFFRFIDDRRLLTAGPRSGVRVTDLSTGKAFTRRVLAAKVDDVSASLSPDRQHVATEISHGLGSFAVSFLNVRDGSGFDVDVPAHVCPAACAMRWSSPHEVVLAENSDQASLQFRVDATTGKGTAEAYREPEPFDVFGVHAVNGEFDKYGTTGWHPEGRSPRYPKGALVTPTGLRIDLGTLDMEALTTAVGDRFFFDGLDGLRLLTSDGQSAHLDRAPPPP